MSYILIIIVHLYTCGGKEDHRNWIRYEGASLSSWNGGVEGKFAFRVVTCQETLN